MKKYQDHFEDGFYAQFVGKPTWETIELDNDFKTRMIRASIRLVALYERVTPEHVYRRLLKGIARYS